MAKIITENFKVETTNELFKSFKSQNTTLGNNFMQELALIDAASSLSETDNTIIRGLVDDQLEALRPESNYYIMASKSIPSGQDQSGTIRNTQNNKRDFQRKVIFGSKVGDSTARYMFYENNWETGTVYSSYDDTEVFVSTSQIVTVLNSESDYLVFKCIENNNGAPSTINPQTTLSQFTSNYQSVETGDKYIWHYMFTVPSSDANIYKTTDSLPLPMVSDGIYGDALVISNAKESVSQIIIEDTPGNLFNQYLFGSATSQANSSDVEVLNQSSGGANTTIIKVKPKDLTGRSLYNDADAYKYMYFRSDDGSTAGRLYEVVASNTNPSDTTISLHLLTNDTISGSGQLVPKVEVSSPDYGGVRAKAYAVIDQFGTVKRVSFETRGSNYKFATAKLVLPKSLLDIGTTTLRPVVSPTGGHGFNPIGELGMSRLSIVTNFSGDSVDVPDSNTYTNMGLMKNPKFSGGTFPDSFDNRVVISKSGDHTATALENYYVEQYIEFVKVHDLQQGSEYVISDLGNMSTSDWNSISEATLTDDTAIAGTAFTVSSGIGSLSLTKIGTATISVDTLSPDRDQEIIKARVHESAFDSTTHIVTDPVNTDGTTKIYLVDYYGDFRSKIQKGNIRIKITETSENASTLSINSFSDIVYGSYVPYTGDLLHFIDFAPITRSASTREKVKFTFDF